MPRRESETIYNATPKIFNATGYIGPIAMVRQWVKVHWPQQRRNTQTNLHTYDTFHSTLSYCLYDGCERQDRPRYTTDV